MPTLLHFTYIQLHSSISLQYSHTTYTRLNRHSILPSWPTSPTPTPITAAPSTVILNPIRTRNALSYLHQIPTFLATSAV